VLRLVSRLVLRFAVRFAVRFVLPAIREKAIIMASDAKNFEPRGLQKPRQVAEAFPSP